MDILIYAHFVFSGHYTFIFPKMSIHTPSTPESFVRSTCEDINMMSEHRYLAQKFI